MPSPDSAPGARASYRTRHRPHHLNPRAAAHRILAQVRTGRFSDRAAAGILPDVDPADRGLALDLAYGCLRLRARLDTWIQAFTDRPVPRIDPDLLDWLRIGAYQLKELRVPDHAAVGETVRWARATMDQGRAGYINAVLRALAVGDRADPFPSRDTEPLAYLSTWGSHPEWLVGRWLERWGIHEVTRLVKHDNLPPDVVVRMLDDRPPGPLAGGVELEPVTGWPRSFRLAKGSPAAVLTSLRAVIQDPAASAVVDYVGPNPVEPVLDVCAAPGTKAVGLAAEYDVGVEALDISRRRLKLVREPARRLGLPVHVVAADARRPPAADVGTLLADVPCMGTGVLRRRADARWRLDEARLAELVVLQSEILDACAEVVRPGGLLVYSTCSLESDENEDQVEAFINRHPEYEREPLEQVKAPDGCVTSRGDLFVRPWITGTDGAYAARLRRAG